MNNTWFKVVALFFVMQNGLHASPRIFDLLNDKEALSNYLNADNSVQVHAVGESGCPVFIEASRISGKEIVKLLLDHGAEINGANPNGETALMAASRLCRKKDTVELLIDRGAKVNAADNHGETALMRAASSSGSVDTVRLLLACGAEVNTADKGGRTALMRASERGDEQVVKLLLDRGAEVNMADQDGRTALMQASSSGSVDTVRLLLDRGANIRKVGSKGHTVLSNVSWKFKDVILLLHHRGAKFDVLDEKKQTPWMSMLDDDGYRPYSDRCSMSRDESEKEALLFSKLWESDLEAEDEHGWTVLAYACRNKHQTLALRLIEHGVKVHANSLIRLFSKRADRDAASGSEESLKSLVSKLLKSGLDINAVFGQSTAASNAIWNGYSKEIIKYLIACGARFDNFAGYQALKGAMERDDNDLVQKIIDLGVSIGREQAFEKNKSFKALVENSRTLLKGCKKGNVAKVRSVQLSPWSPLNISDEHGKTPYMKALQNRRYKVADMLIKTGASPVCKDHRNNMVFTNEHMFTYLMRVLRDRPKNAKYEYDPRLDTIAGLFDVPYNVGFYEAYEQEIKDLGMCTIL